MTPDPRAEIERKIAELQAELARMDAEPWPALRGLIRFHETGGHEGDGSDVALARAKEELAALPLAPREAMEDAPILRGVGKITGDGWRDTTKQGEVVYVWNAHLESPFMEGQYPRVGCEHWSASDQQYHFSPATTEDIAAIRATLTRAPVAAWPEPKPEPEWTEWRGGECPVPAGTRVEVKQACGDIERGEATCFAEVCDWWKHEAMTPGWNIIAYRILPEGGAA